MLHPWSKHEHLISVSLYAQSYICNTFFTMYSNVGYILYVCVCVYIYIYIYLYKNIFATQGIVRKKVKCTPVQAMKLCTDRTAHRGSRGIAVHFHDHGTRRGWGVSVTPRPLFTPGKDPLPVVQEAGWAPGPVWTGAENLAPTGIRSPDRPARSQSLYRLIYPAHREWVGCHKTRH